LQTEKVEKNKGPPKTSRTVVKKKKKECASYPPRHHTRRQLGKKGGWHPEITPRIKQALKSNAVQPKKSRGRLRRGLATWKGRRTTKLADFQMDSIYHAWWWGDLRGRSLKTLSFRARLSRNQRGETAKGLRWMGNTFKRGGRKRRGRSGQGGVSGG